MITDCQDMIEGEFLRKVAEGDLIVLFEGTLNRTSVEFSKSENEESTLRHVPNELCLIELEMKTLDDSLPDIVLNFELEVPLSSEGLHYDAEVYDLGCQTQDVVHVQGKMTLIKVGGDVLNLCLMTTRNHYRVLEALELQDRYCLGLNWLDVQEVNFDRDLVHSLLNFESLLELLCSNSQDVS